ncbi:hypothetical protein L6164_034322 [Bauhinia variegata]|nr:hypothetical protein L6164_034322 [Bauhinia variegata]
MSPALYLEIWLKKFGQNVASIISFIVFFILDFLDAVFCVIYRYLDEYIEEKASPCYCTKNENDDEDSSFSETLYNRRNLFRELGFPQFGRKWKHSKKKQSGKGRSINRWSDCGCESCLSWANAGDHKLHFVVSEPSKSKDSDENCKGEPSENVIFLHGFLSSSSFWTETVFPNLSARLIAVDLLGFGRSPKPRDCSYTLKDHVEMIEKSVIRQLQLSSFHLVAHSMGCIIALALAAKYPKCVKSITLVAPPYCSAGEKEASVNALRQLARKRLWPPLSFASSFMSWYEHLGRLVCLIYCRNHRIWEAILKFITRKRDLHFGIIDLTRHTHRSAWCSMHNVICGGANFVDSYLQVLSKAGVKVHVIQGDKDQVVPMECLNNFKLKFPNAEVEIIRNADHTTVLFGREKEFTQNLEHIWTSFSQDNSR